MRVNVGPTADEIRTELVSDVIRRVREKEGSTMPDEIARAIGSAVSPGMRQKLQALYEKLRDLGDTQQIRDLVAEFIEQEGLNNA